MAKRKTTDTAKTTKKSPATVSGKPVCIAALFCDTAIIGDDQSVTIVRTIDTFAFPPDANPEKAGDPIEMAGQARLVVMLKRDNAVGRHEMPVTFTSPSGTVDTVGLIVQDFPKDVVPEMGYNFVSPIRFVWRGEGLYWMEIRSSSGDIIARTALRLKITPKSSRQ